MSKNKELWNTRVEEKIEKNGSRFVIGYTPTEPESYPTKPTSNRSNAKNRKFYQNGEIIKDSPELIKNCQPMTDREKAKIEAAAMEIIGKVISKNAIAFIHASSPGRKAYGFSSFITKFSPNYGLDDDSEKMRSYLEKKLYVGMSYMVKSDVLHLYFYFNTRSNKRALSMAVNSIFSDKFRYSLGKGIGTHVKREIIERGKKKENPEFLYKADDICFTMSNYFLDERVVDFSFFKEKDIENHFKI